jgi:4-hydroxy-tetrahydrodipicolinate synthase
VHQPVLPYMSRQGWVEYTTAVAHAVPALAVLPYVSSPVIRGTDLAALSAAAPNVVGVKYSVPDPVAFAETVQDTDADLLWIAGLAESYAPSAWQAGARAFTSGLVNVAPDVSFGLLDALRQDDGARAASVWRRIRRPCTRWGCATAPCGRRAPPWPRPTAPPSRASSTTGR